MSVGRDINWSVDGAQQCYRKKLTSSCQNGILKRERRTNSHLRSWSQLLFAMEEGVLVAVARDCVCGPRYQLARGWCTTM